MSSRGDATLAVEFALLGEIEARVDGVLADIGHARQRCVLVALLIDANCPVSADQLADRVWADRLPARARGTLHSYLSRLRQALSPAPDVQFARLASGYLLRVDPAAVDVHRFRRLVGEARTCADEQRALALFEQALELWRGRAFAGLDTPWLTTVRDTLDAERLAAELDRADIALRHGLHGRLVAELAARAAAYPLDERVAGQFMLATYRCGRAAEALEHYRQMRRRLAEELGSDPCPALQRLHQQILGADPALTAPGVTQPAPTMARLPVPRQLPVHTPYFVGRTEELRWLDDLLDATNRDSGTVVISAIGGTAGVGKTALALRWAHRIAHRFPDGQLYVCLRGFDPSGTPMQPAEALHAMLDAFEVPPERMPASVDAQAALYRSLLADRKVLIVLDNVRDADQVRPLLPSSPGCLVMITTRNQLSSLITHEGCRPLTLDVLSREEAVALLVRRLGCVPVDAEPQAVSELIDHCARLPLALAVVAARATVRPGLSLGVLARELRDARTRLDALDAGDPTSRVRAVFSWSYQHLSAPAARTFQLLGVHPGPDISLAAVASLVHADLDGAREQLRELTGAHMVAEQAPGRFAFHDLLRAYAADRAGAEDGVAGRRAAMHRVLDHYLHTANAAAWHLDRHRYQLTLTPPQPGVTPEDLPDFGRAWAWYEAEHQVLLAAVASAATTGFEVHAWQLAWTLVTFLDWRGHWHDWITTQDTALAAARRIGDLTGQSRSHRSLGLANMRLGAHDDAYDHLREALDLDRSLGDPLDLARSHRAIAWVCEHLGRGTEALTHAKHALRLYRAAGDRVGQARALNSVAWGYAQIGDHHQALAHCEQSVALHRELDDRLGESDVLDSLGYTHHNLGNQRQAVAHYHSALAVLRELGDRYHEAATLSRLGDAHHAAGDTTKAEDAWQRALAILDDLRHPDAGHVRAKLLDWARIAAV